MSEAIEEMLYVQYRSPEVIHGSIICLFRGGQRFSFRSKDNAFRFAQREFPGQQAVICVFPEGTPEGKCKEGCPCTMRISFTVEKP